MATMLTPDELTLHFVATGIIMLTQRVRQGQGIFPYPEPLQRGLDRLTIAALRRGSPAPQGVPDLLEWCQQPIRRWPLDLPNEAVADDETLLLHGYPSGTCDTWACANPDVEAELTERRLMQQVFELCSEAQDTVGYVAFRSLLISSPTLTVLEQEEQCIQPDLIRFSELLHSCYQPAPPGWASGGSYVCCTHCGNLLHPLADDGYVCETEACSYEAGPLLGRRLAAAAHPMWLVRGLRRFVAAPGRTELRLAHAIKAMRLHVELWPELDQYDLRITLPNQDVWAIDVKDWANPFLLGRRLEPIPPQPSWDQALIVVPDYRLQQRDDYLRALRNTCPHRGLKIMCEHELLTILSTMNID